MRKYSGKRPLYPFDTWDVRDQVLVLTNSGERFLVDEQEYHETYPRNVAKMPSARAVTVRELVEVETIMAQDHARIRSGIAQNWMQMAQDTWDARSLTLDFQERARKAHEDVYIGLQLLLRLP